MSMWIFWVIIALVVIIVLWLIALYNRFVVLRNRIEGSWAQVDVQLKKRYDLVPNLVETVKGYAKHEREVFEKVTEARSKAISAQNVADQGEAENLLTGALKSLFAVAEAYPELKANVNFLQLQEELSAIENKIAYARQHFNDVVLAIIAAVLAYSPIFLPDFHLLPRNKDVDKERRPLRLLH